jgi:hypothetical protein
MVVDPRRVLETAAEARASCEVLPRAGVPTATPDSGGGSPWTTGQVVRVERGGVVLRLAATVASGADVRVWMTVAGQPWTFEASVLRTGVPVPDRSQNGVLLGFIDGFRPAETHVGALILEVLPHNGGPVSLVSGAARVVDLSPTEWTISTPRDFGLVFVAGGEVRLRIGLPDRAPMELGARVEALRPGDGHLLYAFRIATVEDSERYRGMVAAMRVALGL